MEFDLQPTLRDALITLRPLRAEDCDALYAVASDPLIWEQHPEPSRYQEDVFTAFFQKAMDSGGAFVVIDNHSGRMIGSSRYHGYDGATRVVEIGWTFLARSHWGGVYNRAMKRLMLQHAFQFVDDVLFLIGPRNFRSQRAVEKLGAVRDGDRPDGRGHQSVVYRLSAARWRGISACL